MRPSPNIATGLIALLLSIWAAASTALDLESDAAVIDLVPHMVFAHGTAAEPDAMLAAYRAGQFAHDVPLKRFEGDHAAELWGAVEITSPTEIFRRVVVGVPMIGEVDVYAYGEGPADHILSYSMFRHFQTDQHAGARLQSRSLNLPAGATQTLLVHFKFGPVQTLDLSLESEAYLARSITREVAVQAAFYAFALAAICVFLTFFAALRDGMSLLYALLFLTGLAFLAYMDGLLFRLLYPNTPQIQSALGFFLFLAISGFGFILAGIGFRHSAAFLAARLCWGLAGASVAVYVFSLLAPGPIAAVLANTLLIGMCVAVALGTRLPPGKATLSRRLARGLSLAVLGGVLILLAPLIVPAIPALFGLLATSKLLYLVLILGGLTNLTAQILAVRQAQDEAQQAEMAALTREAKLSRELAGSEKNYAKAQALAAQRQRTLATAAHDIRQPVQSLRLRLDSLAGTVSQDTEERLREALDYLDSLTSNYMENGSLDADAEDDPPVDEIYDVSMILESVQRMFTPEAARKGLELRIVETAQRTNLPAAPLMRIVCNLVVNAIKHSQQGGLVLGLRRRAGGIWLCVADTGPGFTPEEFERYKNHGAKTEGSDGHGFGLAVCAQLAEELGISLIADSVPGRGTLFYLRLPAI
ncbi:sensor histidine kinase [Ruegeria sp. 2012CJ41-6]|uniref:histidine kinase n=1 Tax=Ruegeria spongiae TaxID=2942209 RepID=A0ABT0PXB8_9RHOB|nr:sensor histidine kinase [Ruegeria spongiae]MCL6282245.1 sensor histidine kinase [Ruegeria spongiae]